MKMCLCGSTRFMDQFHQANLLLSLAGHIVYSVATSVKGDFQPTDDQKLALDAVHLRKLQESDAVVVVGKQEDGSTYIGESTRRELMYASIWDKPIYFFRPSEPVRGPVSDFLAVIQLAAETEVEREEKLAQAESEREELLRTLGVGEKSENPTN